MIHTDTIAAIATGMNTAGIGIIRISGDDSFSVVKKIFQTPSGAALSEITSHKVYYGYIYDDGRLIDEVLLIPMKAPKSFTREDTVEINCHGGVYLMTQILKTVLKHGARAAEPGEFTKRAFLNGRIDLSEAEAVIDLIHSKNSFAMDNSLQHLTGKLFHRVAAMKDQLLYQIALIESALDDPEHYDLSGYSKKLAGTVTDIIAELNRLISSYQDGLVLQEGIHTVIVGKPNVGKSSFLNALLGKERAIVTEIAGTTRDSISEQIMVNGINLNVVDTAGIHETEDIVERIGVRKSKELLDRADLVLMILDASMPLDSSDEEILCMIEERRALILLNKMDLAPCIGEAQIRKLSSHRIITISAKEQTGFDEFRQYITDEFIKGSLKYNDEIFISNERQYDLLTDSVNSLKEVLHSIEAGLPEDFLSIDLTNAYDDLCKMTGERVEDDIINEIFSKFCTGK